MPPSADGGSTFDAGSESPVRLVAFYLPQFHPTPENDRWWGEGFTEWTNVVPARPQFSGHYQPQLPTELGLYDLRDPEVLDRQADLAQEYGVHGFCFHHYWFNGRRVLERPVEQMLGRGRPSLPFCISWANENWTRRWDGLDHEILLRQEYEGDWAERFIRDALPILADERYIRVRGAALLLVYRVDLLPDAPRVAERWRTLARAEGLELHLAAVQSFKIDDPRPFGFDAAVEFPPHPFGRRPADARVKRRRRRFQGVLEDYASLTEEALRKPVPDYAWYRGLVPSWDNTARRGSEAYVAVGSSPDAYRRGLAELVRQALERADVTEPLVFVNAWNEWAEGTHLEPDDRYGRAWLEATRDGLADGAQAFLRAEALGAQTG